MTLPDAIDTLITRHGTLTALARATGINIGYLSRLHHGSKDAPSAEVLSRLGLLQSVDYTFGAPPSQEELEQRGQLRIEF